jgi:hypothetical protein
MGIDEGRYLPSTGVALERVSADCVDASGYVELDEVAVAPATAEQGITIVDDASGSMLNTVVEHGESVPGVPARTKAQAVAMATSDTVSRLQVSRKRANFSVGFVAFHERVTIDRAIRPVLEIPATDDFDPTAAGAGGTCVWTGLDAAYQQILDFRSRRSGTLHVSNVVLLMGDGLCSNPSRTLESATRLKELGDVTVAACLFQAPGEPSQGAQLLQQVATSPKFYKTVFSSEQIREFFLASITMAG